MNWFIRVAQQDYEDQEPELTISGLMSFQNDPSFNSYSDVPGQEYFWSGSGWDAVQEYRKPGTKLNEAQKIIRYMQAMFESIQESLSVEKGLLDGNRRFLYPKMDAEPSDEQIEEEARMIAETRVKGGGFEWSEQSYKDWEHFLTNILDDENIEELLSEILYSENLPDEEQFQQLLNEISAYESQWDSQEVEHRFSSSRLQSLYKNAQLDPNSSVAEFYKELIKISSEIVIRNIENISIPSMFTDLTPEGFVPGIFPEWVDESAAQEKAVKILESKTIDWYFAENKDHYENWAIESIEDDNMIYVKDHFRYNSDFSQFCEDYDPEDLEDPRNHLEPLYVLKTFQKFSKDMGSLCSSLVSAEDIISTYVSAISKTVKESQVLSALFPEMNHVNISPDKIMGGIFRAIKNKWLLPEEFSNEEIDNMASKSGRWQDIGESYSDMNPEQIEKLKELQLVQNPFPHRYELVPRHDKTPILDREQGNMGSIMTPFDIAIGPDELSEIPAGLLSHVSPWNASEKHSPRIPAIGSINGYADTVNGIMYVTKMTNHLLDAAKKMVTEEDLEGKLKALDAEIQSLQAGFDEQNLSPDQINALTKQIRELQQDRSSANYEIEYNKKNELRKYVNWKSYIEETYKDWVPVFFNVVLREAVFWTMQKVRVITAKEIANSMFSYEKTDSNKQVFEQIYDQMAQRHGGQLVTAFGKTFWEINTEYSNKNLLYASRNNKMKNWLKKAMVKQAELKWSRPSPNGDFEYIMHGNRPEWQIHIDKYFEKFKELVPTEAESSIFAYWLGQVPEELKNGEDLHPRFKEDVKQYMMQTHNFNPFETQEQADSMDINDWGSINRRTGEVNYAIHPLRGKPIWQIHLDIFWDKIIQGSPELAGPEFETSDPDGFQEQENNKSIFEMWMREVPDVYKVGENDLIPDLKEEVRNYLKRTKKFDPFDEPEVGDSDDVEPMSADDLESMFFGPTYDPDSQNQSPPSPPPPSRPREWWERPNEQN